MRKQLYAWPDARSGTPEGFRIGVLSSAALHRTAHHVAHVGSHYSLHHLAGAFELLEQLVDLRE